ncbi:alpha/beta hydrolase, partial [Stenotrophomonas maltophilia]|nr:alpha/beta hydrolase [Stenotrophomonas maltophilia]
MQRHHLALAGMLASLMLAGCSQPPPADAGSASDAPSRRFGTIDFQPCTLSTEGASANVEAQCATLQVPEDRA